MALTISSVQRKTPLSQSWKYDTLLLVESLDGLSLATVHVYSPGSVPVTVRVWVYCAVTGSFNTVLFPSVTVVESLVQVTVVAGPPVEIQVRVN